MEVKCPEGKMVLGKKKKQLLLFQSKSFSIAIPMYVVLEVDERQKYYTKYSMALSQSWLLSAAAGVALVD